MAQILMNVYILDNAIIFSPSACTLTSVSDSNQYQSLSEPASRCLEKLLVSGELVSQKDLYELGWAGRPVTPSPNTLYQTISSIRRCFKSLGATGINPVLTETRKGFRINPELHVQIESLNINDPTEKFPTELTQSSRMFHIFNKYKQHKLKLIFGIIFMVLVIILSIIINLTQSKSDAFENYHITEVPSFSDCKIFVSNTEGYIHEKVLGKSEFNCSKYPYNYITSLYYHSSVSILSCSHEVNNKYNNCHILYLRGILDEQD